MAKTLCRVAGGGKPLKGNAEAGDVLAGKTFSNKQSNALTGTMPNNGAWSSSTSGAGTVTIPAGYHNGSGSVDCSGAYNSGVADADARVNTSSASYNSGYTNGNAHVTYKDFHVTAQAANQSSTSATTFNAHLNGYTMIGYGFISTGGVGWNWWRPYSFYISNSGENITVGVYGSGENNSGHYNDVPNDSSRWLNLDCTVRVFYK